MKNLNYSGRKQYIITILTLLWLITLPLRNSTLTFSIGGIEIYSNLIITFILAVGLAPTLIRLDTFQKIVLLFLGGWTCIGVVYMLIRGLSAEGIFDIHSLVMQFLFAVIIFGLFRVFEWNDFRKLIRDGLRFYLVLLLVFGFIEFFSLFHITGSNVSKLTEYPVSSTFFAPFFIYDNNNDYCAYLTLLIGVLYLFDDFLQKKNGLMLLLAFILFFFSRFAQSRLGEYISYIYFIFFLIIVFLPYLKGSINKRSIFYSVSLAMMLILISVSNTFFNGKAYLKTPEKQLNSLIVANCDLDSITAYKDLSPEKQQKLVNLFSDAPIEEGSQSNNIRMNLLKNGLVMISEHPIMGDGPGSFRLNHKENKFQYNTDTVSNPHNFVVEIIAQFGVWGWGYFIFLLILFYKTIVTKKLAREMKVVTMLLIVLYPFIGLLPSSFLYINLHWLFLPLITCLLLNKEPQTGKPEQQG